MRSWVEIWCVHNTSFEDICRPLREVVSWNIEKYIFEIFLKVDLFVRSWVEINWVCVLRLALNVDLFVRSWVEILELLKPLRVPWRRPLREVVSWNNLRLPYLIIFILSTSSWGRELKCYTVTAEHRFHSSTSSWGRELKCFRKIHLPQLKRRPLREVVSWNANDTPCADRLYMSTSSWGRELKCHQFRLSSIASRVDLFVRSWVEISFVVFKGKLLRSTSSWGRELKFNSKGVFGYYFGRPLCEVVSWNNTTPIYFGQKHMSTSSWGRELK